MFPSRHNLSNSSSQWKSQGILLFVQRMFLEYCTPSVLNFKWHFSLETLYCAGIISYAKYIFCRYLQKIILKVKVYLLFCLRVYLLYMYLFTDLQKRIELLQDFEMPTVSHCVRVTNDGQYICATGKNSLIVKTVMWFNEAIVHCYIGYF